MAIYLLKTTLIWGILLLIYELLYRRSTAFTLNRIYLFLTLAAGLVIPVIAWPTIWAQPIVPSLASVLESAPAITQPGSKGSAMTVARPDTFTWLQIAGWIYLAGVVVFITISVGEVFLILRKAIYGQHRTIRGHRMFSNEHAHAPFSFMGWIFISCPDRYKQAELDYILQHEDAHNRRKHWLDMILMQLIIAIFWFHPLVWRLRYLLRLTHEYEADYTAGKNNIYEYGHFLVQQTLLKGTPAIAHSFHCSPIKNRITMLTKMKKTNPLKFAITLPVLFACSVLFARATGSNERLRSGSTTTYRGHSFGWLQFKTDTIKVVDPTTNEMQTIVARPNDVITSMDKMSVHSSGLETLVQPRFNGSATFSEYVIDRFWDIFKSFPETIKSVNVKNVVVDETGKIRYFDVTIYTTDDKAHDPLLPDAPFGKYGEALTRIMDNSPDWEPGIYNGKKVNVYLKDDFNAYFKP